MIVTCSSCRTRYHVDPAALGRVGRTVRCARCGHSWMERPPADMPKQVDLGPPPEQLQSLPGGSDQPGLAERRRARLSLIGTGVVVLVVLAVGAAVVARDRITAVWPLAARLYQVAGLKVVPCSEGLKLPNVQPAREKSDGEIVIVVRGEVLNESGEACLVPPLRAELRSADEQVLRSLTIAPAKQRLAPGESTPFTNRFTNPPSGAVDVKVTFDVQR